MDRTAVDPAQIYLAPTSHHEATESVVDAQVKATSAKLLGYKADEKNPLSSSRKQGKQVLYLKKIGFGDEMDSHKLIYLN